MSAQNEIKSNTRSVENARRNYDRMSRWYDLLAGPSEKKYRMAGLKMLDVQSGEHVLEIGCGTGHGATAIARSAGTEGKVTAVDISSKMLEKTKQRLLKAGLAGRCEIMQADAYELPFSPESFDAVFMSFTLELFDNHDLPVVLTQCYKVLKSGGRLVVVAMSKGDKRSTILRFYEWLHQRYPNMIDCRPIFAAQFISETGFSNEDARKMSLAGIPIEIVKAYKK